jgi:hypothetical protein
MILRYIVDSRLAPMAISCTIHRVFLQPPPAPKTVAGTRRGESFSYSVISRAQLFEHVVRQIALRNTGTFFTIQPVCTVHTFICLHDS